MSLIRSTRPAGIAACTALALAAGTLLSAVPATAADGRPAPSASAGHRPAFELPRAAGRSATTYAGTRARPRLDLDGDGWSDWVWRGVFGFCGTYLTGSGATEATDFTIHHDTLETVRDIIAVGNVGGSSRPELLTLSFDGRLSLHPTTTKGAGAPTWSGYGWQVYNRVIGAGDLNRDGHPDLLARTPSGDMYLYKGTGKLTGQPFAPRTKVGPGWGAYDQLVGTGDLDGDGVADLLARTLAGNLFVYKGTGSAAKPFRARVKVGPGWNAYNQITAVDDADGDGRADVLARAFNGKVYWYLSTGGGRFAPRREAASGWEGAEFFFGSGITPNLGKHSIEARGTDGKLYEYVGKTNGAFFPKRLTNWTPLPASSKLTYAAGLDKFNWGTPLETKADGTVSIPYSDGARRTGLPAGTALVAGPGDLTGDGRGDLLSRDSAGRLWLHPGTGSREVFKAAVKVGNGWDAYDALVGGGDVTGDGRADLVARKGGTLYLFPGTGSAAVPFARRSTIGTGWSTYDRLASPGDLNGDGRADLVARDGSGRLWRYTATGRSGSATFAPRGLVGGGWNVYTGVY
ncbi:VCBS repeat-containing protein [Streptomyces sp. NRRL S-87]|uniref:FG-GAP repeat domain-containing protein n=1 Tax=Streptomyces sp. NRRL S-87 TaxID=1463920 RepID=UPI0004BF3A9E|nr:VCBS repeat-containing protein [Streptomyces sp. NRRL S-87]